MSNLIITFVSLALLLITCQANLLSDFCSKSINPSLCNQVAESDPRTKGADAVGLAAIAIEKAEAAIRASANVAKSVTSRSNKQIIDTCVENFGEAASNLKECKALINKRSWVTARTLESKAAAAMTDIDTCNDEFGEKEPRQLKEATEKANAMVGLLLIISKSL